MTIGEVDFTEPLINAELTPPMIASSLFTAAEHYVASIKPLSNGHGDNPVSHDPEAKVGTTASSQRWVWGEVREQCWLAGPIMAMYLLQYIISVAGTIFVGHLGSLPLAAFSLANAFTSITGFTLLV